MDDAISSKLPGFLSLLGLDEEPMGLFYSDDKPAECLTPKPNDLPTREKEMAGEVDWQAVFGNFTCTLGLIWRARKKKLPAVISAEEYGCPGSAFWMGFLKPQSETIISYISTGIPNAMEGEKYCGSPDVLRGIFEDLDPRPAPGKYCIIKPLSQFTESQSPEFVIFFTRPESLCGLHQLATFASDDPQVVTSPWSSGCGSLAIWPLYYLAKGETKAVIGGWDPSARKFFKTDELFFSVPLSLFNAMLDKHQDSFLSTKTWSLVEKKIERSKKAWGEAGDSQ